MSSKTKSPAVKPAEPDLVKQIENVSNEIDRLSGVDWQSPGHDRRDKLETRRAELRRELEDVETELRFELGKLQKVAAALKAPAVAAAINAERHDEALRAMIAKVKLKAREYDHKQCKYVEKPTGARAWVELQKNGASDEQIKANLKHLDTGNYGSSEKKAGGYTLWFSGNQAELWRGSKYGGSGKKLMSIEGLVKEVRRIKGIGEPTKKPAAVKKKVAPPAKTVQLPLHRKLDKKEPVALPTAKREELCKILHPETPAKKKAKGAAKESVGQAKQPTRPPLFLPKATKPKRPPAKPVEMKAYESIDAVPWQTVDHDPVDAKALDDAMNRVKIRPPSPAAPPPLRAEIDVPFELVDGNRYAVITARHWNKAGHSCVSYTLRQVVPFEEFKGRAFVNFRALPLSETAAPENVPLDGLQVDDDAGDVWVLLGADRQLFVDVVDERSRRVPEMKPAAAGRKATAKIRQTWPQYCASVKALTNGRTDLPRDDDVDHHADEQARFYREQWKAGVGPGRALEAWNAKAGELAGAAR